MKKKSVKRVNLVLEAGCTLREGIDMQFLLLSTDCSGKKLIMDGSQVERIDTAGVQLLVAFVREQQKAGKSLQWSAASELLVRSCRRLGVDGVLGLPAEPCAEVAPA